jgi:hypothetical protein
MEDQMRTFLRSLLLFASIFTAAYVARILIVPDVVAISEGEQSGWQIDVAFFLTSVQNIGLSGAALVVLMALLHQFRNLVTRSALTKGRR